MERNAETLKGIWILCNSLERKYYMDPLPKVPAVERAFDDRVIILGNGESRKELDLAALKKWCPLFGCNALFTEFPPDILFVVDRPISEEVNRSQYARTHKVVARCPECCTGAEKWIGPGWSAGNVAILYACRQGYKKIYLVGFDLWQNEGGKINNIYKGREHYYGPEHIVGDGLPMLWAWQFSEVLRVYDDVAFFKVGNVKDRRPEIWLGFKNLLYISMENFLSEVRRRK